MKYSSFIKRKKKKTNRGKPERERGREKCFLKKILITLKISDIDF